MHEKYIDFSLTADVYAENLPEANSEKHIKNLDGKLCIVKFPDPPIPDEIRRLLKARNDASYSRRNTALSEYIGSHIFKILGFKAQDTVIGKDIRDDGKEKEVVGCVSILSPSERLLTFQSVLTQNPGNGNPRDSKFTSIMQAISSIFPNDSDKVKDYICKILVVDAFIQNYDRNNRNWGFIKSSDGIRLSPIYDCGSSLFGSVSNRKKRACIDNPYSSASETLFTEGDSAIRDSKGKRMNHEDILSIDNPYMRKAIIDIIPKINVKMNSIMNMIDGIPLEQSTLYEDPIHNAKLQKDFYKIGLQQRKELVIDKTMERIGLSEEIRKRTNQLLIQNKKNENIRKTSNLSIPKQKQPSKGRGGRDE